MIDDEIDILIVGGGLIGAILLVALEKTGLNCLLIESGQYERDHKMSFDTRSLALSEASIQILTMLNIWQDIQTHATSILKIHVSQKGHFGSTKIVNDNQELGVVIEIPYLMRAIINKLNTNSVWQSAKFIDITTKDNHNLVTIEYNNVIKLVKAKIVVGADGTNSLLREKSKLSAQSKHYNSAAIVANIQLARNHHNIAYERFTAEGPLALLPLMENRMSLVWTRSLEKSQHGLEIKEKDFLLELQHTFGYRAGKILRVGQRHLYKLNSLHMPQVVQDGVVFIGNAANTLHPVAGQGFNLGLRDVAMLLQCLNEFGLDFDMLTKYQSSRISDQQSIRCFTNSLINSFASNIPGSAFARGSFLFLLDNSALLKKYLIKTASGYLNTPPDLACGLMLGDK